MRLRIWACAAALTLAGAASASADVVLDWNEVLLDAIRFDKTNPPKATRIMAVTHVSIFEAVNGIQGGYESFHATGTAPAGASVEAAAAAAAHRALSALFPAQQATFDAALAASLAAVPDGAAEDNGKAWGVQCADAILALRGDDHAGDVVDYTYPTGGGWWAATPPAFAPALLPNWPQVTPWTLRSGAQFRGAAPPSMTGAEYLAAFDEVRRLGRKDSGERSADQTQVALFWADGGGTETPPGHWLDIAAGLSAAQHLSLAENARLFALLGMVAADAAIVSWDHKYAYHHWRPVTGIRGADSDGNATTVAEADWESLIATPPFPAYTSGHSTFSGSMSRLLAHFFGSDQISFSATSDGLPGVTRQFTSLSQAAEEAGQSRIYGGIHWQYDNQQGLRSGRALADQAFFTYLQPVVAAGTCAANDTTLCLGDGRFKVTASWKTHEGSGPAHATDFDGNSGAFWFFSADNTEIVVKVLDACAGFDRFWVFASGLTDVEVLVTVTDTQTGSTRRYFNPRGRAFAPVQDVDAFATCH